jgi:hypothetical protein
MPQQQYPSGIIVLNRRERDSSKVGRKRDEIIGGWEDLRIGKLHIS